MPHRSEERIDLRERFNLVAEELDAVGHFIVGREDFDDISTHAEGAASEVAIVTLVENFNQAARDVLALDLLSPLEQQQHAVIRLR